MRLSLRQQICASSNEHQYQRSIQDSNDHTWGIGPVQWTEQLGTREVHCSHLCQGIDYLEGLRGLPQTIQKMRGRTSPWQLPFTPLPIHYSSNHPTLRLWSVILLALLNNPQTKIRCSTGKFLLIYSTITRTR
jgi:hypothetical protein